MLNRGKFIVVEGLEGAGKTTAIQTIDTYLRAHVPHIVLTREPGGTHLGEALRTLIKTPSCGAPIDSHAELLLMYAARVQLIQEIIRPALERGEWVIADRFELSTYAYQGGGRGIALSSIDALSKVCLQGFKPDWTLFLDITPAQGLARVKLRGEFDRIEQESLAFFTRVYDGYQQQINRRTDVYKVDASQTLPEVQAAILSGLKQAFSFS